MVDFTLESRKYFQSLNGGILYRSKWLRDLLTEAAGKSKSPKRRKELSAAASFLQEAEERRTISEDSREPYLLVSVDVARALCLAADVCAEKQPEVSGSVRAILTFLVLLSVHSRLDCQMRARKTPHDSLARNLSGTIREMAAAAGFCPDYAKLYSLREWIRPAADWLADSSREYDRALAPVLICVSSYVSTCADE